MRSSNARDASHGSLLATARLPFCRRNLERVSQQWDEALGRLQALER
jgi:hypothetical protein